jgi:hypothetical protein
MSREAKRFASQRARRATPPRSIAMPTFVGGSCKRCQQASVRRVSIARIMRGIKALCLSTANPLEAASGQIAFGLWEIIAVGRVAIGMAVPMALSRMARIVGRRGPLPVGNRFRFFGKIRGWAGRDRAPRSQRRWRRSMVGGSTGTRMVAVHVAIAHRGPRDVPGWSRACGITLLPVPGTDAPATARVVRQ